MKDGILFKIALPGGFRVVRWVLSPLHLVLLGLACAAVLAVAIGWEVRAVAQARQAVVRLRSIELSERARLRALDAQTAAIGAELKVLGARDDALRELLGAAPLASPSPQATPVSFVPANGGVAHIAAQLARLQVASSQIRGENDRLTALAERVLNVHHLRDLAQAQLLAAIPSIDPVPGSQLASGFGWRTDPWPEFHDGLDLDAPWGTPVHATAAGTVAFAGWDGGYGMKIDLDHGNGYHTWYCHLSRIDVAAGQHVTKDEAIAAVGSTGESTGPHLHYEIVRDGRPIDPSPYLAGAPPNVLASTP